MVAAKDRIEKCNTNALWGKEQLARSL